MTRAAFATFARQAAGDELASFARAKTIALPVAKGALASLDDERLRALHREAMDRFRRGETGHATPEVGLLDAKREIARRLLRPCRLCALECRVDRLAGPAGVCSLGPGVARYLDFVHLGEEPEISPTHALLLAGCNYRCAYCSDWAHVAAPGRDPLTTIEDLARSIDRRRTEGVASLSWIGGDPGVNLPGILDALALASVSVPVVWNSNGHSTDEVRDLLEGVVDAYVLDLKHGNDACAREVARAPRYLETVVPALERAAREAFTIVRHLVLPGHVECCTVPALQICKARLPGVRVNLMGQYRPNDNVAGTALDRRPSPEELSRARAAAGELGLAVESWGRLAGPRPSPSPSPAERGRAGDGAAFESGIYFDEDGRVTIENLSPDLADLAKELGLFDPAP